MEKQKQIQDLLAKTLAEAWGNEAFKKELIAKPLDAIESLTGEKLNLKEGTKMVVVDQSEKDIFYFNIPKSPKIENVELSEEQLDMVAGGGWRGALYGAAVGALTLNPIGVLAGAYAGHKIEEAIT